MQTASRVRAEMHCRKPTKVQLRRRRRSGTAGGREHDTDVARVCCLCLGGRPLRRCILGIRYLLTDLPVELAVLYGQLIPRPCELRAGHTTLECHSIEAAMPPGGRSSMEAAPIKHIFTVPRGAPFTVMRPPRQGTWARACPKEAAACHRTPSRSMQRPYA